MRARRPTARALSREREKLELTLPLDYFYRAERRWHRRIQRRIIIEDIEHKVGIVTSSWRRQKAWKAVSRGARFLHRSCLVENARQGHLQKEIFLDRDFFFSSSIFFLHYKKECALLVESFQREESLLLFFCQKEDTLGKVVDFGTLCVYYSTRRT